MKKLLLTLALVASSQAFAQSEIWEGQGVLFKVDGTEEGAYSLVVKNTKIGAKVESLVTVTLADGSTREQKCTSTGTAEGKWQTVCDNGGGGGQCLGEGLCISYIEDGSGKAYATTMVFDGPNDMRLLRTELKNGEAVRFFREKLHKN